MQEGRANVVTKSGVYFQRDSHRSADGLCISVCLIFGYFGASLALISSGLEQ